MDKTRVLIVDDEEEFAATLAERLVLRNFDAVSVNGAEEATTAISHEWVPDVILLDLKMPGIGGLEAIEILKKRCPTVSLIMLTGHGSTSSGIEGMKRGLYDYMMKPVDIGDLTTKIEEIMGKNPKEWLKDQKSV